MCRSCSFAAVAALFVWLASSASANLLTNPSFETGDFSGWTTSHQSIWPMNVTNLADPPPTDGSWCAQFYNNRFPATAWMYQEVNPMLGKLSWSMDVCIYSGVDWNLSIYGKKAGESISSTTGTTGYLLAETGWNSGPGNGYQWISHSGQFQINGSGYESLLVRLGVELSDAAVLAGRFDNLSLDLLVSTPAGLLRGSGNVYYDPNGTAGLGTDGLPPEARLLPATVELEDLVLDGDLATLAMYYDPAEVAALGLDESTLRLYWYDDAAAQWVLAGRNSNIDDSTGEFVAGLPTDVLGDWGLDMAGDYVWANIDHASAFGIAGTPEPTAVALLALGSGLLLRRRRRSR